MNLDQMVVALDNVAWQQAGPNCRMKEVLSGGQRLRLVEFQKGFEEEGWCEKGHVGYVVEGRLDIEFSDKTVPARIGDAIFIPAGHETRHRAHVVDDVAQLILFEHS